MTIQTFSFRSGRLASRIVSLFILVLLTGSAHGQTPAPAPVFPRVSGYQGILHPIVTLDKNGSETNFRHYYVVGFPIGLNLWKTKQLGFSVELVPVVRAQNGTSRVSNVVFHPGVLVGLGHDFTFAGRLAFETSGRYGITPVFSKIVKKGPTNSYFVAVPLPIRLGNGHAASFTAGFQFGIVF
ncbi:hypothetical protein [Dyadobacter sandarakinus]|uniref:Outer membrane protein beta-barrel domain-containing protein n=1 Tax=Dyadobacter sandarakinus TaxID=2747268 RepID=A0ABX7I4T1_9BACT|nr:hypothetical protein [Dyadobacter sandarakinus]QRR00718.1 hypothetical protein HWI92_07270 [Dyadobacter sandarakinus]